MEHNEDYLDSLLNSIMSDEDNLKNNRLRAQSDEAVSTQELSELIDEQSKSDDLSEIESLLEQVDSDDLSMKEELSRLHEERAEETQEIFGEEALEEFEEEETENLPQEASEAFSEVISSNETSEDLLMDMTETVPEESEALMTSLKDTTDSFDQSDIDSLLSSFETMESPSPDETPEADMNASEQEVSFLQEEMPMQDIFAEEDWTKEALDESDQMNYTVESENLAQSPFADLLAGVRDVIPETENPVLEETQADSSEEINNLAESNEVGLNDVTQAPKQENENGYDDIADLLGMSGESEQADEFLTNNQEEVSDNSADAMDVFDIFAMEEESSEGTSGVSDEVHEDGIHMEDQREDAGEKKKKKKEKKAKKKKKSDGADSDLEALEDIDEKKEKKGVFSKMMGALLEEEEPEEAKEINLSDENKEILEILDEEEIKNKIPEKGKKKEKEKKPKKEKAKKDKKPKKEKAKKEKEEPKQNQKKIPFIKIFLTFIICITIMVVVILLSVILPSKFDVESARKAYYSGDYAKAYSELKGKKLSDSDQIIYERCMLILNMQNKLDLYRQFLEQEKKTEAINELFLGVSYYSHYNSVGEEYDALDEMKQIYKEILQVLDSEYQVSEAKALEIMGYDELSYNMMLYKLVNGKDIYIENPYLTPEENEQEYQELLANPIVSTGEESEPELIDPLAEETELIDDDSIFINESESAETVAGEEQEETQEESEIIYSGNVENGNVVVQ